MKNITLISVSALLCVFTSACGPLRAQSLVESGKIQGLLAAGSPESEKSAVIQPESLSVDPEEQQMLRLINQHRADYGLHPLALSTPFMQAARWLSDDMASKSYMSHTDSLNRDPFTRMASFNALNSTRGENIAAGYGSAAETYQQWLGSPGHNSNMLTSSYSVIGIARAYNGKSGYGWYWTTDFGSPN
jgi:uncharacterized protein YkwD